MNNNRRRQIRVVTKELSVRIISRLSELRPKLEGLKADIEDQMTEVESIRMDEEFAYENTPENLQGSQRYLDSEEAIENMSDAIDSLSDAIDSLNDAIDAVNDASISLSEIS